MTSRSMGVRVVLVTLVGVLVLASLPLRADPLKPTLPEVKSVVDVLRFRSGMLTDPAKTVDSFALDDAKRKFSAITEQMTEAGGGPSNWRLLLGTSVFTATGLDLSRMLVVFYNPWVDTAVFTVWEARKEGRRIVDVDWLPGDLVRQANAEVNPRPLWLRGEGYRPEALAQSVVTTIKAIETRFSSAAQIASWRDDAGVRDTKLYHTLVTPMLAMTLYETQLRLKAFAVAAKGEDPRLAPLRRAAVAFIKTTSTEGFAKPLSEAKDTTAPMKQALSKINPKTMIGLAPVAFVVGKGHATVFFASTATADYTLSARYAERPSGYALQQLEFIPYAATYQATISQASGSVRP